MAKETIGRGKGPFGRKPMGPAEAYRRVFNADGALFMIEEPDYLLVLVSVHAYFFSFGGRRGKGVAGKLTKLTSSPSIIASYGQHPPNEINMPAYPSDQLVKCNWQPEILTTWIGGGAR